MSICLQVFNHADASLLLLLCSWSCSSHDCCQVLVSFVIFLYLRCRRYTFDCSSVSFSFAILFAPSSRSRSGRFVVVLYTFYYWLLLQMIDQSLFLFLPSICLHLNQSSFSFLAVNAIDGFVAVLLINMFIIFVEYIVLYIFNRLTCQFSCPKGRLLHGLTRSPLTSYLIHHILCMPVIIWGRHFILLCVNSYIHACNEICC